MAGEPRVQRTDVVIPVYSHVEWTRRCIASVLDHSGPALGRVFLVHDCGPEAQMLPMLRDFRLADRRVVVLENERNRGFVSSSNRGLALCRGDAVLLNADTRVTPGWLEGLRAVAASDPRIAAITPVSNNGFLCSVPVFQGATPASRFEPYRLDLSGLPLSTEMPTVGQRHIGGLCDVRAIGIETQPGHFYDARSHPVFGR
ncbi:MAG: glycosyltransferase, partial [Myxococcaceae bacterium]|nr:glycosyltransferase [Myxococcaceae bacterium]